MLATLLHTLQRDKLFPPNQRIVLAVSGGADSLALLHACAELRAQLQLKLHVASFDHRLRGEAGAADVAFVQDKARKLQIPCSIGHADVQQVAIRDKLSIEAAARQERYAFLARVAHEISANTIATAHHADDQVETILMHILRGSGLDGLRGMQTLSQLPGATHLRLVRPLLEVSRQEIESYCAENHLIPREDSTNADLRYLRNALRHELLPVLRGYNPSVDTALLRLSEIATTEADLVEDLFTRDVQPHIELNDRVTMPLDLFRQWHSALQRRALRYAAAHFTAQPGHDQIVSAQAAVERGVGALAELTANVQLRVGYEVLSIEAKNAAIPKTGYYQIEPLWTPVVIPGETTVGRLTLYATRETLQDADACLDIPPNAVVGLRTRRPGDRFQPLGMNGHTQKIKKWLIDHKVPQSVRDYLPLLIVNGKIAALLLPRGWAIAEFVATTPSSQFLVNFSAHYN